MGLPPVWAASVSSKAAKFRRILSIPVSALTIAGAAAGAAGVFAMTAEALLLSICPSAFVAITAKRYSEPTTRVMPPAGTVEGERMVNEKVVAGSLLTPAGRAIGVSAPPEPAPAST